ncbi:MAG TPA: hypothetical protein VKB93_14185 [Thermoanaerobaculia bacterium]|nr:hypothetical protein [Thermoanaerobaculia bacterium]
MFRLLEQYLSESERTALLDDIARHDAAFRRVDGKHGIGPRYSVIDGTVIAERIPSIAALAERIRPIAEDLGGMPLALFGDATRRMRVQRYDAREDGFRWHFDGHALAAVVTLENESEGVTELVDARVSRFVKPLFYAAYAAPQLASLLPRHSVKAKGGDVLVLRGRQSLHRGRSQRPGRRTILVFAYDRPGARPARWRNLFAKLVNY